MCCRTGKISKATDYMDAVIKCCYAGVPDANQQQEKQIDNACDTTDDKIDISAPTSDCLIGDWTLLSSSACLSKAIRIFTSTLIDLRQCEQTLDFVLALSGKLSRVRTVIIIVDVSSSYYYQCFNYCY